LAVGDEVVLTVTDDGAGYVDGGRTSGLRNMTERAEALGGSFEVRRAGDDGGTVAVWRVPSAPERREGQGRCPGLPSSGAT